MMKSFSVVQLIEDIDFDHRRLFNVIKNNFKATKMMFFALCTLYITRTHYCNEYTEENCPCIICFDFNKW